jgi:GT2 family glycosyltransferase
MKKDKDTVYIVILNYNHLDDLKETIHSFLEQDYPNMHIIVSDNGSTDNSLKWLHKEHPEITVIENKKNFGWAEGNNVGIRYALKHKADYILLANNDLSFQGPSIITSLIKAYDLIPKLGIIGPSENSYFEKDKIVNQGWIMYPKVKHTFNKNRSEYTRSDLPSNYKVIDNVSGSFMIIKRRVFEDIGEIDGDLFLYAEDADFSLRAWKKGWVSLVDADIMIYHKISATSGINSPLKIYYMTRNLIYLIRKHRDIQSSQRFFTKKYYFDIVKQFIKMSIKSEYRKDRLKRLKALFLGFYHGAIIKKMGQFY